MLHKILRGFMHIHILHHASFEPVWGSMIARELAHHGYKVSSGTLYPLLHKMASEGYLVASQQLEAGRKVVTYRNTAKGDAMLQDARSYIKELHDEVVAHAHSAKS